MTDTEQMLTPVEKIVVNLTVLSMAMLLTFAIYTSMPTHAQLMASRFWFHVTGAVEEVVHNVGIHKPQFKGLKTAVLSKTEAPGAVPEAVINAGVRDL